MTLIQYTFVYSVNLSAFSVAVSNLYNGYNWLFYSSFIYKITQKQNKALPKRAFWKII